MFFINNLTAPLNKELYVRLPSPLVPVEHPLFLKKEIKVWIKREDLIHPIWGGNKFRKLKYNLNAYKMGDYQGLVTFGGLHSNHIYACAAVAYELGIPAHGIIRGAEDISSPTLEFAHQHEMKLHRIDRQLYRQPEQALRELNLGSEYYILPEGGTNTLALEGCAEIGTEIFNQLGKWPDGIVCSFGTGGTAAGLLNGLKGNSQVYIFPALKGNWIKLEMERWLKRSISNFQIFTTAHFGGYGKIKPELIDFIQDFYQKTGIPLDPIYTGKMVFGFMDLMQNDQILAGSEWVLLHSGGLQGNLGFNQRFKTDLPIPDYILRNPS